MRPILSLAAITLLFYVLLIGSILLPLIIYYMRFTRFWWFLLCYFVWWIYDRNTFENGGRIVPAIKYWKLFDDIRNYFPSKLVLAEEFDLDPAKNYLFSCHPHAVFAYGLFLSVLLGKINLKKLYPFIKVRQAALQSFNLLPLCREFVMSLGIISCSEKSLTNILTSSERGQIVCLLTGGAQELLNTYPGTYRFVIKNRRGFIKIALKTGASLVPVITFGDNDIFSLVDCSRISWLRYICKNWFKCEPFLFYGRGFTKNSIGWIPFQKRLTTVGKPINVEKVRNPTDEQIGALHARYVEELSELFHKYKFYLEHPYDKVLLLE